MKPERTPIMEGNEIEKAAVSYIVSRYGDYYGSQTLDRIIKESFTAGANWQKERDDKEAEYWAGKANENMQVTRKVQADLGAELTRTNAQLDEMVTKYNELSKKYADLRKKHYSQ